MHTVEQYNAIHLIRELLADSRSSYQATANRLEDACAQALLRTIAEEREAMVSELGRDLVQHEPWSRKARGNCGGTMQRAVLDFRDLLIHARGNNVLLCCQRQDTELCARLTAVLDSADLTEGTRATLARQCNQVERDGRRMEAVRNSLATVGG